LPRPVSPITQSSVFVIPSSVLSISGDVFIASLPRCILFPPHPASIQLKETEPFLFQRFSQLAPLLIPRSVQRIRSSSFAMSGIESLTFSRGASLSFLEQRSFHRARFLHDLVLPASLRDLPGAFLDSGLRRIVFESRAKIQHLSREAFSGAHELQIVTLPASLRSIGPNAFAQSSIHEIRFEFPPLFGPRFVPEEEFPNINTNQEIDSRLSRRISVSLSHPIPPLELELSDEYYASVYDDKVSDFQRAPWLQKISSNAFFECKNLSLISIPASVNLIESDAFKGSGLQKVSFAPSPIGCLRSIQKGAFSSCPNLQIIHLPSSILNVDRDAFRLTNLSAIVIFRDSSYGQKLRRAPRKSVRKLPSQINSPFEAPLIWVVNEDDIEIEIAKYLAERGKKQKKRCVIQ